MKKIIFSVLIIVVIICAFIGYESMNKGNNNNIVVSYESEDLEVTWQEITVDGVDEEAFFNNLDVEVLKEVATELQILVEEEIEVERENPEILITEGWIRVFDSEHYKKVLNMGDSAIKPLYWIIYKSENEGMYEYICATALSELTNSDFTNEEGILLWSTSKEFLKLFNNKILND